MEDHRPAPNSGLESAGPEHPQSAAGNSGYSGLNKGKDIVLHNSYSALAIPEAAGRIWLAWDSLEVGIDVLEIGSQFIHSRAVHKRMHTRCLITVLYGDYDIIPRRELWTALRTLSTGIQDEPWLILGDFNAVMDDSEVCGQAADTSASMAEFRSCIRDTGLVTLPFTGCPFTWHNCSEGPRSLWKRFLGSVANIWKHHIPGTAMYEIVCKLKLLKAEFRRQTKRTGELSVNVRKAKEFLDKAQALFSTYHEDIYLTLVKCCRRVYAGAVKLEISMLQQRAKLRWLKHGDQNSKVFFRKINLTRVKQRVFQVAKASGETLTNRQEVIQEFISYFQTLIGGSSPIRTVDLGFLQHELRQITPAEASLLVATVTAAEVKEAFFDIEVESAPGPDGFGSAFYRAAWPVVGQSMLEAVGEFFRTGKTPQTDQYHSISFDPEASFSVSLNGAIHGFFKGGRGLRQGDPMSPYLFVLVMEVGSALLRYRVQQSPQFQYHWKCKDLGLINLCFADDVLLFCKADIPSIKLLTETLSEFATFSGLKVNPSKSQIIFSRAVQQRQQLLDCVGFQEGSLPIKYLGIPLTSSRLTLADCRPLIDKVDTRLAGWNHQHLSYAGRLQLIKSVLSTLHMYWASVFILPKGVLKMLERKMRTFLWQGPSGGRQAKVAWDQICKPKAEGGLGLRSLIIMNQALILKQMWRVLQNDGSSIWWIGFSVIGFDTQHFGHSIVQRARGVGRKCSS
ncbi:UNVERIFIED_CONTAM: hypothetical protein Sradi_7149200 [Sesamum radiatum]|uniref:Reverse transcriptase domain-containing protein n=1 Tax=Sesamum radiatum TaxID=300843 RepID=A0AAW2IVT2_SESRA